MKKTLLTLFIAGLMLSAFGQMADSALAGGKSSQFGLFGLHRDIGKVGLPGNLEYNAAAGTYLVTGGGSDMWNTSDNFHFVWKQMSGDLALAADITWPKKGGAEHRKACLMIRQTLDPSSSYADVVVHGNGMTSLQYRITQGGTAVDVMASPTAPVRVRIEKHGDTVSLFMGEAGGELKPTDKVVRLTFKEPFYVGLAVCAHDDKITESALFSKVELVPLKH
jgi:TolB protein